MINILKTKKLRFILLLFIVAFSLTVYKLIMPENIPIEVLKTDPLNNQELVETNKNITVFFNQDITKISSWSIASYPNFDSETKIEGEKLIIILNTPLMEGIKYKIEIANQSGFYYNFSFTTKLSIPVVKETGLGDPDFAEKLQANVEKHYPLLKYIYYEEPVDFKINYNGALKLVVTLQKDTPLTRKDVLEWIKERGVDPETHEITWKVQR